ncbi:hypothetical protein [Curtobacterium sp. VKM Ac-2852]|uniref:hypothetical protein n=1 Tax=Curtobacterium sp. VKM Ac-2852 TaxID=2739024 RepID=UPI0015644837|nr:hypothetical protein [Curtobacterium sp. VKM Ac-2852]NQX22717.1 hypothetical protein [Curtobacterium sp. VKM Ac-2852]
MSDPQDARDGSASICTHDEFAPIQYHWYSHSGETFAVAVRQLLAASGLTEDAQSHVFSEVGARMKMLRKGQLREVHHVKGPVDTVTDIDLFEVRVRGEVGEDDHSDVLVRIYHTEPTKLRSLGGSTVIGLHMHIKDVSDPAKVRERQDEEMQKARDRFFAGRPTSWT